MGSRATNNKAAQRGTAADALSGSFVTNLFSANFEKCSLRSEATKMLRRGE
jgi:hypothetical protein